MFSQSDFIHELQANRIKLHDVPAWIRTKKIILAAVRIDGNALKDVPANHFDPETYRKICLAAVQQNSAALQEVSADALTPQMYREICLTAMQKNEKALGEIPDKYKELIFNSDNVAALGKNYSSHQYFPKDPHYKEEMDALLASVEYIIMSLDDGDAEINDISLVYSNAKKRAGKTISVTNKKDLKKLLLDLERVQNPNDIHLVLAGHGHVNSDHLASMSAKNIINVCKKHPQIKHIQLLGCNVAKAKMPKQEKEMINNYVAYRKRKTSTQYGLQYMLDAPANDVSFQKDCHQFCVDNHLAGVFILSKDKDNNYRLLAIKINEDNSIRVKITSITANRIANMDKIIRGTKGKPFKFPTKAGVKNTIRDKNVLLTSSELAALRTVTNEYDRFDPLHPKYKQDKTLYPFLATIDAAVNDLQTSYMKELVDGIASEPAINWEITIKGPTKALHVNTKENCLIVSRTHLYQSKYDSSLFGSNKANLNQDKLKDERKKEIKSMEDGTYRNETMAKSLRVKVKGKA